MLCLNQLSQRETAIARLVASGLTNQAIADALFLSDRTIKNHLTRMFRKINVKSRTALVVYCIERKVFGNGFDENEGALLRMLQGNRSVR